MQPFNLTELVRKNIQSLVPYSSARSEYDGAASVFLDANENSTGFPEGYNRYPDPLQMALKEKLAVIKGVPADQIFLGNGSDEAIDLLFRIFCDPGKSNVLIFPPTYGMYEVSARINDVAIKTLPLTATFQLDMQALPAAIDEATCIIFICSPNNPTGNLIAISDIEQVLNLFAGIVMVDEAYIDFADEISWAQKLANYPNLVVLQTLSKAWGLAGLRLGMAFASPQIIDLFNKVKPPYNIGRATQQLALQALSHKETVAQQATETVAERLRVASALQEMSVVLKVFPSDANFLLVRVADANVLYQYLLQQDIVVRNRSNVPGCHNCLRITIGAIPENDQLLTAFKQYNPS